MKKSSVKRNVILIVSGILLAAIVLIVIYSLSGSFNKTSNPYGFQINEKGQTYGSTMYVEDTDDYPDLIAAIGYRDTEGYVLKDDFLGKNIGDFEKYTKFVTDKTRLTNLRNEHKFKYVNYESLDFYDVYYDIPVYAEDGEEVVDKFQMCMGTYPFPNQ